MDLNLEVNPVKVYCVVHDVIDNERNSITMERALRDPKVAEVISYRLKGLEEITSKFFDAIVSSLDYVPYGIRWLCKAIYQLCRVSHTLEIKSKYSNHCGRVLKEIFLILT